MAKKLRARHYLVLFLFAIVTLETTAITIDRLFGERNVTALELEDRIPNHDFVNRFKTAAARLPTPTPIPAPVAVGTGDAPTGGSPAVGMPVTAGFTLSRLMPVDAAAGFGSSRLPGRGAVRGSASAVVVQEIGTEAGQASAMTGIDGTFPYAVRPGETLSNIATLFGITTRELIAANPGTNHDRLQVGQKLQVPVSARGASYTVKPGDSLSRIASRFGLTIGDLIAANELASHRLTDGQKLRLPVRAARRPEPTRIEDESNGARNRHLAMVSAGAATTDGSTPVDARTLRIVEVPSLTMVTPVAARQSLAIVPSAPSSQPAAACTLPAPTAAANAAPTVTGAAPAAMPVTRPVIQVESVKVPAASSQARPASGKPAASVRPAGQGQMPIAAGPAIGVPTPLTSAPDGLVEENSGVQMVTHTVSAGENLSVIARRYRTTAGQIHASNPGCGTQLKVGQQLQVPVSRRFYRVLEVNSRHQRASVQSMHMPVAGNMTDQYGWRVHPVRRRRLFHSGIDLAAPSGTPIFSANGGVVSFAGWLGGYGRLVVVRHDNGVSTYYGHCSRLRVRKGQRVRRGQLIANVGSTGVSTGPHLHFEVRVNNRPQNPMAWLRGR